MGTKARLKFLNRAARFDADIEFVDVINYAVQCGDLTPPAGAPLFTHLNPERHRRLSRQQPNDDNRQHVAAHLRKTVFSSYIKDLYEDFSAYLEEIIVVSRKGFKLGHMATVHKVQLDANDILDSGSWEGVLELVTESVFDRLGGMSNTARILQALGDLLGLELDGSVVTAAQPFVDLRHLLVHADGIASPEFCREFPDFGAFEDEPIRLTVSTVHDARIALTALVEHVDGKAIAAGLVTAEDMQ